MPAAVARRFSADRRRAIGSAWATRTSDPLKARSLMTSISSNAVPDTGTVAARPDRVVPFPTARRAIGHAALALGVPGGPGLGHLAMLFGKHACGGHTGHRRLQLVLPAADDVAVATHHGVESYARHIRRVVLRILADFRVQHVR